MEAWSAPGSVLLAGEYRITEEGGRGISLAAGGRAYLRCAPQNPPGITGNRGQAPTRWTPDLPAENPLATAIHEILGRPPLPDEGAALNLEAFYNAAGRKLGLGSSAAAALLITAYLTGTHPTPTGPPTAPPTTDRSLPPTADLALKAHRRYQAGSGSGYDILTSLQGGAGIFTGGPTPRRTPLKWPPDIVGWLLPGPRPVNSPNALTRYQDSKSPPKTTSPLPPLQKDLDTLTEQLAHHLKSPKPNSSIFTLIADLSRLSSRLGAAIGVPAVPFLPRGLAPAIITGERPDAAVKCSGAGDELALLIHAPDALSRRETAILTQMAEDRQILPLRVDPDGYRREAAR